ncbi:MAG TPA: phosphate acyltransferase PlsX [Patescibacteria group bacterium]|nr:phosphate acyltransferase PlsX [Patescibacteria group bacterium]
MGAVRRIALDAMGGDFAPHNEVKGAVAASRLFKGSTPVEIVFIGREAEIRASLKDVDTSGMRYSIAHADDVVTMDDEPSSVIKKKRQSSLYIGVDLHKKGEVEGFVSAGNTGAVMSTATLLLGRIKGVSRPTIGAFFPTEKTGIPTLVLDVGANVDSKPRHLYEFGVMGSIYSSHIIGNENPRVGLLNVGEEEVKGTEVVQQAHELLKNSGLNFIGNVEGRDIFKGSADVVVCDGFIGNIVLKFGESMLGFLKSKIKSYSERGIAQKLSVGAIAPTLKKVLKDIDYQEYGGVPLLGVNGVVIIGHGSSSPMAIQNMLLRAVEVVEKNVNNHIEAALNSPSTP